jgi:hypothetical protein
LGLSASLILCFFLGLYEAPNLVFQFIPHALNRYR